MAIIQLKEEFNHLKRVEQNDLIVCGSENYSVNIDFSDDWSDIQKKVAIFMIEAKKYIVEFEGSSFNVPALPNATTMTLKIMSAESEAKQLVTSSLRFNLKVSVNVDSMSNFNSASSDTQSILMKLDGILDGSRKVKCAETADVALGNANPTLLINGDFKINQRGNTIYNCTGNTYTVDRWMGFNGLKVTKNTAGITISNTNSSGSGLFQQKLEETYSSFAGQALTLSAKIDGEIYSLTITFASSSPTSQGTIASKEIKTGVSLTLTAFSNGIFSAGITLSAGVSLNVSHIKLELGTTPTTFTPRTTAEELALCQRYYQVLGIDSVAYSTYGPVTYENEEYYGVNTSIPLISIMRTTPTIEITSMPYIRNYNNLNVRAFRMNQIILFRNNEIQLQFLANGAENGAIYVSYSGIMSLDSEIY